MRLLDRYVLRNFLEPFLLCFSAFLGILLIFDLNDNLSDFLEAKAKWGQIGVYYLHQLPHFCLLSMPLGLLADRISRTRLMALAESLRAGALLLLLGLIVSGQVSLMALAVIMFFLQT